MIFLKSTLLFDIRLLFLASVWLDKQSTNWQSYFTYATYRCIDELQVYKCAIPTCTIMQKGDSDIERKVEV